MLVRFPRAAAPTPAPRPSNPDVILHRTIRTAIKLPALASVLLLHLPLSAAARGRRPATRSRDGRPDNRPESRLVVVSPIEPGETSGGARATRDFLMLLRRRHAVDLVLVPPLRTVASWRRWCGGLLFWPLPIAGHCRPLAAGSPPIDRALTGADVVLLEGFDSATRFYLSRPPAVRVVLREYEVLLRRLAMERDRSRGLERLSHAIRLAVCWLVSRVIYARVDRIVTLTEEDRLALLAWFPHFGDRTRTIRTPFEAPDAPLPTDAPPQPARALIMVANFHHRPNVDAYEWFLRECAPYLDAGFVLHIFGQDAPLDRVSVPTGDLRVERHGFVDDLVAAAPQARIAVAPVVSGGGIRIKNLLLATLGKAVVTTPLGNEGIGFVDGQDAVVCDDGRTMASRINALATSPSELARLGANAAAFVRQRFGPEAILDQFEREVLA
jgi:polysaccharide biosynthesis protein PslH